MNSTNNVFSYQQFCIHQNHAAMKVGTDSDLLGTLSEGGPTILDIGTGTGVLSLMLAQRYPAANITAIEIDADAIIDARQNIDESPWPERIKLHHISFQDYLLSPIRAHFHSVVCNPPYFDRSLECPDQGRTRARHSSSLPFPILIQGAYSLIHPEGVFSVCIPPEVFDVFLGECLRVGFSLLHLYKIQTIPDHPVKRFVLVLRKGRVECVDEHTFCMRNDDRTRSQWYKQQMSHFLICGDK